MRGPRNTCPICTRPGGTRPRDALPGAPRASRPEGRAPAMLASSRVVCRARLRGAHGRAGGTPPFGWPPPAARRRYVGHGSGVPTVVPGIPHAETPSVARMPPCPVCTRSRGARPRDALQRCSRRRVRYVGHGSGVPTVVPGAPHAETPPVARMPPCPVCTRSQVRPPRAPEGRTPE